MDSTGDATPDTRSQAEQLIANDKSHAKIWRSQTTDRYCWVFIPPGVVEHQYSGFAKSVEKAEEDIILSAEHFILSSLD